MKKIKIFLISILLLFSFFQVNISYAWFFDQIKISIQSSNSSWWSLQWKMKGWLEDKITGTPTVSWVSIWLRNILLWVVFIITVWAFVYTWIKLATSRWNPDEFKKTWMHLIYIIIWLFIVFASWWIINLVASLSKSIF